MKCRHCGSPLGLVFLDLGHQPPSNAYLTAEQLEKPETWYPLKVFVCEQCWLVQIPELARAVELFTADYAYYSSVSSIWVEHARDYVAMIVKRLGLGDTSLVVELASNDGYLLQFMHERGIQCLGIEPTASTAEAARRKGIETLEIFFGMENAKCLAAERGRADLIIGNNVLAHVPDINDFVGGICRLLAPGGIATLEFPHLLRLVEGMQFDTVYHEHYSYLSLHAVRTIFESRGLCILDVEELPTHGGSLRVYAGRAGDDAPGRSPAVDRILELERSAGMLDPGFYTRLQPRAEQVKYDLLGFLLERKKEGETVAGYGAAAKGNSLLNYAGIGSDLLPFVCDAAPSKQGKYLPGSHIPIVPADRLDQARPDYVLIFPWNIRDEIMQELEQVRSWGGRFVTAVPGLHIQ